jgi:KDO2-lipid IV(A) lauroyltransferase
MLRRLIARLRLLKQEAADVVVAAVAAGVIALVRLIPEKVAADVAGKVARTVGMWLPRSRKVGLANLAIAFPEKTEAERRAILAECWDNLGRLVVEYCQFDRIWDFDPHRGLGNRVEAASLESGRIYDQIRDDGKPAIIISAHLANWELPMLAAAAHGIEAAALYRAPNNKRIADWVLGQRRIRMGELIPSRRGSVHRLSQALQEGKHLGLLTDQYFYDGIKAPFFGRMTLTNQTFARLARLHDCPVHAVRVIRLPGDRFRLELTEALDLPRDASGRIDPAGAARVMNELFERWIREYPGQWLWLHRKWRDD